MDKWYKTRDLPSGLWIKKVIMTVLTEINAQEIMKLWITYFQLFILCKNQGKLLWKTSVYNFIHIENTARKIPLWIK